MLCELLAPKPVMNYGNEIPRVNKEDLTLQKQTGSYFLWTDPRESFQFRGNSTK